MQCSQALSTALVFVSVRYPFLLRAPVSRDSTRIQASAKCACRRVLPRPKAQRTQLNIRFLADFSEDDAVEAGEVPDVPEERCVR